ELLPAARDLFLARARSLARISAVLVAYEKLNDLFEREGYARALHLFGEREGTRWLEDRIEELYPLLVIQTDERLVKMLFRKIPPDLRHQLRWFTDFMAEQRRAALARGAVADDGGDGLRPLLAEERRKGIIRRSVTDGMARSSLATRVRNRLIESVNRASISPSVRLMNANRITRWFAMPRRLDESLFLLDPDDDLRYVLADFASLNGLFRVTSPTASSDLVEEEIRTALADALFGNRAEIFQQRLARLEARRAAPEATAFSYGPVPRYLELGDHPFLHFFDRQALHGLRQGSGFGWLGTLYAMDSGLLKAGWSFLRDPTRQSMVSWVLAGHPNRGIEAELFRNRSGFRPGSRKQTAFPIMSETDARPLRENPLLNQLVPLRADLDDVWQDLLTAALYRQRVETLADRSGYRKDSSEWQGAYERYINMFQLNAEYWLRRSWLYEAVHRDLESWAGLEHRAQQSFLRDESRGWRSQSPEPPPPLEFLSRSERQERFGDAWDPGG
ncbi:MAG: hypothetical protein AAF492_21245, partial [Verrucomicrobiota bacterium]